MAIALFVLLFGGATAFILWLYSQKKKMKKW